MPGSIDYSLFDVIPDPDTKDWWDATKEKRFLVRQCSACEHKFFPPYPACPKCNSMDLGWYQAKGGGIIYSYTVVVHPILEAFVSTVPYVVAVIELLDCTNPDGSLTRVVGVLTDDEDVVAIGRPVEVVFEELSDTEYRMPRWSISGEAQDTWKFQG